MNISYEDNRLERVLSNERLMRKRYTSMYEKLNNRMSELKAANNLSEIPHLPPPRRHKLTGNYDGYWGIDVSRNFRIILKPTDEYEENNLETMCSIHILKIEDYH